MDDQSRISRNEWRCKKDMLIDSIGITNYGASLARMGVLFSFFICLIGFHVSANVPVNGVRNDAVVFAKSYLEQGQKFLYGGQITKASNADWIGDGLEVKLVNLVRRGASLYIYEDTSHTQLSSPTNEAALLDEFPIVAEDDQTIAVDFAHGREHYGIDGVNLQSTISAFVGSREMPDGVTYDIDTRLVPTPLAQTEEQDSDSAGASIYTMRIRYFLKKDWRNASFRARTPIRGFGYFKTQPVLRGGNIYSGVEQESAESLESRRSYITKWDINKPIVFTISQTTPLVYRRYIEEGILAWNSAFGRAVLQAEIGDGSESFGDINKNVIFWENNSDLDGPIAFGPSLAHPVTGEIFTGHVNIYGAKTQDDMFGIFMRAASLGRPGSGRSQSLPGHLKMGRQNFHSGCHYEEDNEALLLRGNPEQDQDLQAIRSLGFQEFFGRYLKLVVMHEVGHVLGLRHNFMGSFAAGTTPSNASVGSSITRSVMDYIPAEKAFQIDQVQFYDKIAIAKGYNVENGATALASHMNQNSLNDVLAFCTDTDVRRNAFCNRHDLGADIHLRALEKIDIAVDRAERLGMPNLFLGAIVAQLAVLRKFILDDAVALPVILTIEQRLLSIAQSPLHYGPDVRKRLAQVGVRQVMAQFLLNGVVFSALSQRSKTASMAHFSNEVVHLSNRNDLQYRLAVIDALRAMGGFWALRTLNSIVLGLQEKVQVASDSGSLGQLTDRQVLARAQHQWQNFATQSR